VYCVVNKQDKSTNKHISTYILTHICIYTLNLLIQVYKYIYIVYTIIISCLSFEFTHHMIILIIVYVKTQKNKCNDY